jgi:RHS repeat-associated protein
MASNYDLRLFSQSYVNNGNYTNMQIVMPDGAQYNCDRTSSCSKGNCTDYTDAVFQCTNNSGSFFGAVVSYNSSDPGWNVRRKDGETFYFPNGSALTSITDRYQNSIIITRNYSSGNPTKITDSTGRYINFYYTDSSNPEQITRAVDNVGRTVNYTYTSNSQMASVQDADGNITQFTWGSIANMATVIYPIDNLTGTITFNSIHRVTGTGGAFGDWICAYPSGMQGNGIASWCQITNPNSVVRQLDFDNNGYVTEDIQADGLSIQQTTQYARESGTELVSSVTDQLGRVTAYLYDALSNILSITRLSGTPQAVTTSYTYDPSFSQVTSVTDPLGHRTNVTIDGYGNATARTDPLGNTTTATYNSHGQITGITDPLGTSKTSFGYDSAQNLTAITDPLNNKFMLSNDSLGRLATVTDPYQKTSTFGYDAMSRITSVTDANQNTTHFGYDLMGRFAGVTDANGHSQTYGFNYFTNTLIRCDGANRCETINMDPLGNIISMIDGRGLTTDFTYDGLNRLTNSSYNSSNQPPNPESYTNYTWDGGNRLTSTYDCCSGTDGDTMNYAYDRLDDLTGLSFSGYQFNEQFTYSVAYGYDNAQRRKSMTAGEQTQTAYTYDNDNRLTGETLGTQSVGISYDVDSRRASLTLPNGVTVSYDYDLDSHATGITYSSTGGGNLGNLAYGYDNDGRVNSLGGSLAAVNMPSAATATYDAGNQLATWNGITATTDGNGNLLYDPSIAATYAWNERNLLGTATSGAGTSSYLYDALGRRAAQEVGSTTITHNVYDGLNIAEQQGSAGTSDMMTGLGLDDFFARTDPSGTYAMMRDALGSTIGLVNSSGAIATPYTYGPFGQQAAQQGQQSSNPFQYTGRETDPTGLDFMRARYYNPIAQRFISPDPIGLSGGQVNFYAYAGNDPTGPADSTPLVSVGADTVSGPTPAISPPAQAYAPEDTTSADGAVGNIPFTLLQEVGFSLPQMMPGLPQMTGYELRHGGGHGAKVNIRIPVPAGGYNMSEGLGKLGDLFLLGFLSIYLLACRRRCAGYWR